MKKHQAYPTDVKPFPEMNAITEANAISYSRNYNQGCGCGCGRGHVRGCSCSHGNVLIIISLMMLITKIIKIRRMIKENLSKTKVKKTPAISVTPHAISGDFIAHLNIVLIYIKHL